MPRAVLRAALFAIVSIALWAVARPAYAMPAPFCDDRGATAIAQPPTLEAPDVAVQRARLSVPCDGDSRTLGATLRQGRAQRVLTTSQSDPAAPGVPPVLGPRTERLRDVAPLTAPAADGVVFPLDRPPRV